MKLTIYCISLCLSLCSVTETGPQQFYSIMSSADLFQEIVDSLC